MNREEYILQMVDAILLNYEAEKIAKNPKKTAEQAYLDDSVTGNASGSFTFDRFAAYEYVSDWNAQEIISDMLLDGFITNDQFAERYRDEDFEWIDVCIRCYLFEEAFGRAQEVAKEYIETQDQQPEI